MNNTLHSAFSSRFDDSRNSNLKPPKPSEVPTTEAKKGGQAKVQPYLNRPSPFLRRLLGRNIEPDSVDESDLPDGILTVLADNPQQALVAALRCRPLTYDQAATIIGVSRDRARQLEIKAAANLRLAYRFRQLRRFIPGWQNALRLPPEDAGSLLPGETIAPDLTRRDHWQYKPQVRRAFELTLASWERLCKTYGHGNDEGLLEKKRD